MTDGLTVDGEGFFCSREIFFIIWCCKCWISRGIFCCVVVDSVSAISSHTKFYGVCLSCCVKLSDS